MTFLAILPPLRRYFNLSLRLLYRKQNKGAMLLFFKKSIFSNIGKFSEICDILFLEVNGTIMEGLLCLKNYV